MTKCFVDTNVLVYAKDSLAPSKQSAASRWIEALINADKFVISAQSLREFYAVSLRRDRSLPARQAARDYASELAFFVPEFLRLDRLEDAWALEDGHKLGFWDAHLVASAIAAGCTIFLSEDLNNGQKIDTLTIVNPFTTTPEALLGA